jgi:hypothetical protein
LQYFTSTGCGKQRDVVIIVTMHAYLPIHVQ